MKQNPQGHLNDAEILKALIDEADLGAAERVHLSTCRTCRQKISDMEAPFLHLGRLASRSAPQPPKYRRVPVSSKRSKSPGWTFGWRPALASAVGVLLVVIFAGWYYGPWRPHRATLDAARMETTDDASLMAEVDALIDEALPEPYAFIAADDRPRFTDEFIRFVAPVPDRDSLTFNFKKRDLTSWQTSV